MLVSKGAVGVVGEQVELDYGDVDGVGRGQ